MLGLLLLVLAGLTSCRVESADFGPAATPGDRSNEHNSQGAIRVFAASSLAQAFDEIAASFEQANPGLTVEVNFGASSTLREQILDGAPVDVFAPANELVMAQLTDQDDRFESSINFAANQLVLAVPSSNSAAVTGLEALGDDSLFVGLCAPEVPCGQLAQQVLTARDIQAQVDTYEPNVQALTNRLIDGELDAALIYATNALAAGDAIRAVEEFPGPTNRYPIAARTRDGDLFIEYVTSKAGQDILATWGFGTP